MKSETASEVVRELGPVFRSSQAVASGVSWRDLYALRDSGALIELSRGVFQLADVGFDRVDYVAVSARVPDGMICLDSALEYWDLTDQIPPVVHVAVPSGAHRPTIDHPPTRVHVFKAESFVLGRLEVVGEAGDRFWITDRERTVVDVFRLRHLVGSDVALEALATYWRRRGRDVPRLVELAGTLGGWTAMYEAIQVLQA